VPVNCHWCRCWRWRWCTYQFQVRPTVNPPLEGRFMGPERDPDAVHAGLPPEPKPVLPDREMPPKKPLARLPLPPKAPSAVTDGRASLMGSGLL
jgi:hypothetical protein